MAVIAHLCLFFSTVITLFFSVRIKFIILVIKNNYEKIVTPLDVIIVLFTLRKLFPWAVPANDK